MKSLRQFQKEYSVLYDALYSKKNYDREVSFIEKVIATYSSIDVRKMLSLGCGTCGHSIVLAKRGYFVTGLDISKDMLKIAEHKIKISKLSDRIELYKKDVRNFSLPNTYDFAMAMFNIVGYLIKDNDLESMLKSLNKSLRKGGLLIFDCWHESAVLSNGPRKVIKKFTNNGRKYIRHTRPKLILEKRIIEIRFKIDEIVGRKNFPRTKEKHTIRYWSIDEIVDILNKTGFILVKALGSSNLRSKPSSKNWNIFVIAQKI